MEKKVRARAVVFVLALIGLSGCVTAAPLEDVDTVAAIEQYKPDWQPLFKGIDFAAVRLLGENPQALYAMRVDLKEPTIEFVTTPSNGDKPAETDGQTTTTFLEEQGCQVAINGSPFTSVTEAEGSPKDILGLAVHRGQRYSEPNDSYSALIITKDNHARIASPPIDPKDAYTAIGGFGTLLREGQNMGTDGARHPRTAVGISKDARYMYLLVIDGRQGEYSAGATTQETAQWLLSFGAWDALNLDGGGSTEMVKAGQNGKAIVINRPIHANIPGLERVSANHLGVYAKGL